MPRLTHDPLTEREIDEDDDYDYARDPLRDDPFRLMPNDLESVNAWQAAENAAGRPAYLSPWQSWNKGKWWNVPKLEQEALIDAETAEHPWQEIIEARLADSSLYYGTANEIPTPWDGTLAESTNWGNIVTVTRIGVQWLRLQPDALGRGMAATKTISGVMRRLGWRLERMRVPGMENRPKVFIKPDWTIGTGDELTYRERNPSRTMDDDIPF